ncbi:hypothetical protein [Chryseobacterium sp. SIMBA_029]|uniref:hypothetical protein n=1 Tax=Chryseobacterium sp. SIMBA_029 TaxID=3085772 RepID=UPI00397E6B28
MKKMQLSQLLKGTFYVFAMAMLLGITFSCSKDDDDDNNVAGSNGTHKVVFKAEASSGSNISIAVYGYDANATTATSLNGTSWSSPEITVPAGALTLNAAVNATGANASSTLKVQIYVDGVLKKEGTSSGQYLSASANHTF